MHCLPSSRPLRDYFFSLEEVGFFKRLPLLQATFWKQQNSWLSTLWTDAKAWASAHKEEKLIMELPFFTFHQERRWCRLDHNGKYCGVSFSSCPASKPSSIRLFTIFAGILTGPTKSCIQDVSRWGGSEIWEKVAWVRPYHKNYGSSYEQERSWVWHFTMH